MMMAQKNLMVAFRLHIAKASRWVSKLQLYRPINGKNACFEHMLFSGFIHNMGFILNLLPQT